MLPHFGRMASKSASFIAHPTRTPVPAPVPLTDQRSGRILDVVVLLDDFWSEWQDLNLRPPRPERGLTLDDP